MKVRALAKVRPTYFAKGLVSLNDNISLYSDIFQLQLNNNNNNNDNDNVNVSDGCNGTQSREWRINVPCPFLIPIVNPSCTPTPLDSL